MRSYSCLSCALVFYRSIKSSIMNSGALDFLELIVLISGVGVRCASRNRSSSNDLQSMLIGPSIELFSSSSIGLIGCPISLS
jgi:hypothetical protein